MEKVVIPSPAQLALAIAIVKLKPVGIEIKGKRQIPQYLLQIRQNIRNENQTGRASSRDKFLDSVAFWQQAYERSEAEQSKLLDRIYELEQRNESLLARIQGTVHTGQEEDKGVAPLKRKATAPSNGARNNTTMRKRAKTQTPSEMRATLLAWNAPPGSNEGVVDMSEGSEQFTAPFMRQFYTLQKVLQKRPNHASIVKAAVELCSTATRNVLGAIEEPASKATLQLKKPDVLATLHSTASAYELLIRALNKLSATEKAMRDAGRIIYQIVRLYEAILEALSRYCLLKTSHTPLGTTVGARTARRRQRARTQRSKTACMQKDPDDETATEMSALLSKMALSLDKSSIHEQSVLEGFLFVLLSRVGKLLCLFTFQDLRLRPDLRVDPSKLPLPEGLKEMDVDDKSLHAAAIEAKHLVWPLERIVAALDAPSASPSDSGIVSRSTPFVAKVKDKLQGTLLQSVFGPDSTWATTLQRPVQPEERDLERLRACTQIPEQSVPDWFVQEVWRLFGWELVAMSASKA
ncbi:hypothetical protein BO70DRAFT_418840 [Aspergillus heteromorphus CBS 117.55]|uniref:Uncharacterized protein n=1 Tax=Aspergillus heteromorphus CBS 117.55 TaxID=1448321 RepID=A0A317V0H8_9EURO|nr:uncharacterized protein BO70DRAFT_418840 [Aspergillus heteromorphus CBS 117.55]PWY67169.1 hypothetical protein BO70DRAFT_418840 [Aspergillus heteromorphus CBS 117.55]